jgi:hypothetical protein
MSRAFSLPRSSTAGRRGISTVIAAIVLVVILALVGVTSYALLGGFDKNASSVTCAPKNSPQCGVYQNLHDVSLLLPFQSVQQNSSVPFTASLPSGETTSAYVFDFGDGSTPISTSNTIVHHAYETPGTYIVSITATVGGQTHDNWNNLIVVTVTPSFSANTAGNVPTVVGSIVGNSTVQSKGATGVVAPGQFVSFNASYTSNPTNPQFTPVAPTLKVPTGATIVNMVNTSLSLNAKVSFGAPGVYPVVFVAGASFGNVTAYENYTWTVFVASHASVIHTALHTSPHPGTYINYELAPGGAYSEDPAIDYETVGYEPILNVYQTLIQYNGSSTGPSWQSYVPVLATCVPGSPQCSSLYGTPLVDGNNFTFVIQRNASFYDPLTANSWPVYPTDVLFSVARTMGFSTLPCVTCNNGWILTQALLSKGNGTWSGIHGSYNNTPQNIYNAVTLNETANHDCPDIALVNDHGCVTFHASGNGKPWPYFLELIADGLGGSIVPCGWFSAEAQAAGIPYWTQGNLSGSGDRPCGEPGSPGFGLSPSSPALSPLGWDQWEQLGSGVFGTYQGHVQFNMVGSGPYYMADYEAGSAYTMKANPAYGQNPYCTWSGCQPAKGQYASVVQVTWETEATPGEQAYLTGVADHATIPSTDFSLLLQLISKGQVRAVTGPTLSIGFYPFDLNFNLQGAQRFATSQISVPTDFFSYVGMRAYFAYTYPYQTILNTISTVHGVQLGFLSGGAIPQFMANYYPTSIPWPNQDPCSDTTDVACPTYWWSQMQDHSSPFYDKELASCSSSSPCEFPLFGATGSPASDEIHALWASKISQFSNGALKVDPLDINFATLVGASEFSGPGQNPMPIYSLGWAPDYPDPTDYVNPLYLANATYTYGDAVSQSLLTPLFGNPLAGCAMGNSAATSLFYAQNYVNTTCQGFAYNAMLDTLGLAAFETNATSRVALYAEAEQIAFHLFLYVYTGQGNSIQNAASWVDPSSFNSNVTIGGGGDIPFFQLTGNGVQYAGST